MMKIAVVGVGGLGGYIGPFGAEWAGSDLFGPRPAPVGIWHETYCIGPGQYETTYGSMPPFGLGKVGRLVPATGPRATARARRDHLSIPE